MAVDVVYKHSSVTRTYTVDFATMLSGDSTITAASTVTAVNSASTSTPTLIGTVTVSSMTLAAVIQAGTDGEDYRVLFTGVGTTTGRIETFVLEVRVRNVLTGAV
jgi:hypothetical protein